MEMPQIAVVYRQDERKTVEIGRFDAAGPQGRNVDAVFARATCTDRPSGGWPLCQPPVPAESAGNRSCTPVPVVRWRKMPSASGGRQDIAETDEENGKGGHRVFHEQNGDVDVEIRETDPSAIAEALDALPDWTLDADSAAISLPRFVFGGFEAFAFMTRAALAAERLDHHPEWSNVYRIVEVRLTTHSAGGLTELDFRLAAAMEGCRSPRLISGAEFPYSRSCPNTRIETRWTTSRSAKSCCPATRTARKRQEQTVRAKFWPTMKKAVRQIPFPVT